MTQITINDPETGSLVWTGHQGLGAQRPWLARITGTDPRYRYERDFIPGRQAWRSRSGRTARYEWTVGAPGLYQLAGEGFRVVRRADGVLSWAQIDEARAAAIAARLDAGDDVEAAWLATGGER